MYWFLGLSHITTTQGLEWAHNALCRSPPWVELCGNESFWCSDWNILGKFGQYHSFWCPGPLCHQVISSHNIYSMQCAYSCLSQQSNSTPCDALVSRNDVKYKHDSHDKDSLAFNSLGPSQSRRHFADNILKCNFLNENVWIPIKISLKVVPKGPINNIASLVQIMAWCSPGDKPLSEPMMATLMTRICITPPQWIKQIWISITLYIFTPLGCVIAYWLMLSVLHVRLEIKF